MNARLFLFSVLVSTAPALAQNPPPRSIPFENGFVTVTREGTLGRFQRGYGETEWSVLVSRARAAAEKKKPNQWRSLFLIVKTIDADWTDKAGKTRHTRTEMSADEIERFRKAYAMGCEMAFALSGGALEIVSDYRLIETPVRKMDSMGEGLYWLNVGSAISAKEIPTERYDSVIMYYRPGDIPMGLLGGTYGKDYGIAGAATSTVQIPESQFGKPLTTFNLISVATLHEWLHQVSFAAQRIMGYVYAPDCHCAEEYGFHPTDGGYVEWLAHYRELMSALYPEAMWRMLTMRGDIRKGDEPPINAGVAAGPFYDWADVRDDWQRKLPLIGDIFLRAKTNIPTLTLALKQYRKHDYVQLVIGGLPRDRVLSPITDDPAETDDRLNNVLSMRRPALQPKADDPAGFSEGTLLEGLAWVRYRTATRYRDLIAVRMDLVKPVLGLMKVIGSRPPSNSVLGFISLKDPEEGHPINFLVLDTDLGRTLPRTEAALLRTPRTK